MLRPKLAYFCGALALCAFVNSAHAYDLSRQEYTDTEKVERGFFNAQVALWEPLLGTFNKFHQTSLEFGAEVGFRFLSWRGQHNFFVVGGLGLSLQKLDPSEVPAAYNNTTLILGYGGVRYIPTVACTADGEGCLFFELRLGLAFESANKRSGHEGPSGDWTVLPGIGYRFRLGSAFHLGVRADASLTAEGNDRTLGWVTVGGFLGVGW